ncbi:MAG: hypothetical protein K0S74_1464 [Chlamydiales bacterium]|jgi:hypothetical protein|nr:hypothetical protein [Chlamydiales bacterium]
MLNISVIPAGVKTEGPLSSYDLLYITHYLIAYKKIGLQALVVSPSLFPLFQELYFLKSLIIIPYTGDDKWCQLLAIEVNKVQRLNHVAFCINDVELQSTIQSATVNSRLFNYQLFIKDWKERFNLSSLLGENAHLSFFDPSTACLIEDLTIICDNNILLSLIRQSVTQVPSIKFTISKQLLPLEEGSEVQIGKHFSIKRWDLTRTKITDLFQVLVKVNQGQLFIDNFLYQVNPPSCYVTFEGNLAEINFFLKDIKYLLTKAGVLENIFEISCFKIPCSLASVNARANFQIAQNHAISKKEVISESGASNLNQCHLSVESFSKSSPLQNSFFSKKPFMSNFTFPKAGQSNYSFNKTYNSETSNQWHEEPLNHQPNFDSFSSSMAPYERAVKEIKIALEKVDRIPLSHSFTMNVRPFSLLHPKNLNKNDKSQKTLVLKLVLDNLYNAKT